MRAFLDSINRFTIVADGREFPLITSVPFREWFKDQERPQVKANTKDGYIRVDVHAKTHYNASYGAHLVLSPIAHSDFYDYLKETTVKFTPVLIHNCSFCGGGKLHVQGAGKPANHPWGFAGYVYTPVEFTDWVRKQTDTVPSLDGAAADYIAARVSYDGYNLTIRASGTYYNCDTGAELTIPFPCSNPFSVWLNGGDVDDENAQYTRTKSLASDQEYIVIQGRQIENDGEVAILHLQGKGPKGNRPYGFSANIRVPALLGSWIDYLYAPLKSLSDGSAQKYVPMQVRYNSGVLNFQIRGNNDYNRPYGAAFRLDDSALGFHTISSWLTK